MRSDPPRILLTGRPGSGKTTAILRTLERLDRAAAGFYTEEVRSGSGARVGFDIASLDGRRGVLARAGAPGPRVGRYGVDIESFEAVALASLRRGLTGPDAVLVLDELGKMEFLSPRFVALLEEIFDAPNPILGTILSKPHPVADRIRKKPGLRIVEVTRESRDRLPAELAEALRA